MDKLGEFILALGVGLFAAAGSLVMAWIAVASYMDGKSGWSGGALAISLLLCGVMCLIGVAVVICAIGDRERDRHGPRNWGG